MNKNNFITFKFLSSIYIKLKETKLSSLDSKIQGLQTQVDEGKVMLEQKKQNLDILIAENILIKKDFYSITKLFENENKTMSIKNNNYDVALWENVSIRKQSSYYVIQSKKNQVIYVFNENMNDFLNSFLALSHSVVILSVDKYRIVLQLRLLLSKY
jgi:deoxycytidine triphosphate deaminase